MFAGAVRAAFLAVFLSLACAEVVYRWDKTKILPQMGLNNWRATSFAHTKDKIFLTLVDVEKQISGNGVVGAFNKSTSTSPDVTIFPFQNFYKINDPDRGKIITPMSVRTDECDRLWLLDSAVQNISGIQMKSNPGIYIFNTKNSQLVRSFSIPATQWTSTSFFVNFVLGTENTEHDCEETYGYFADFNRFHILTYDFLRNKSELKSHPFFSPDPLVHTPENVILNHNHQDLNGVYGLSLVTHRPSNEMDALYFHPLAATHEFRINTRVLKTEGSVDYRDVEIFKDKGEHSESGVSTFDPETETIFFAEVNTRKIGAIHVKESKPSYYRYDVKIMSGHVTDLTVHGSELWMLVDDKEDITIHKLSIDEVIKGLQRGTTNAPKPQSPSSASHTLPQLAFLIIFFPLFSFL